MKVITVLGGYGTFGGTIARALARLPGVRVRIAGRDPGAGEAFAQEIGCDFRRCDLLECLSLHEALTGSAVVIHAAGPFQGNDYRVAEACLECGSHYLDIADARDFVAGIGVLDEAARHREILIASGASSVPGISHALVTELQPEFAAIDEIVIALAPGNQNPRGRATIGSILFTLGRPLSLWRDGKWEVVQGWGEGTTLAFPPPVGHRRVYHCDAPDLALFPTLFDARTVRFLAGLELGVLNRALAGLARSRRWWAMESLPRRAHLFLKLSRLLNRFGSRSASLAVWVRGSGHDKKPLRRQIALVTETDGPAVPSAPAILLARKILESGPPWTGAAPCTGLLTLAELVQYLGPCGVCVVHGNDEQWEARS